MITIYAVFFNDKSRKVEQMICGCQGESQVWGGCGIWKEAEGETGEQGRCCGDVHGAVLTLTVLVDVCTFACGNTGQCAHTDTKYR